jgi:hypothetical protein
LTDDLTLKEFSKNFVTKRTFLAGALIIGFALSIVIAGVVAVALLINDFQQHEIAHNRERVRHEATVNRKQTKLINELHEITHPTPAQADRQLREGIRRCLSRPLCRRLFPQIARVSSTGLLRRPAKPTLARPPGSSSTPLRRPPSARPSPKRSTRPGRRPPSRRPATPATPSPPPSSGPPTSPPAVDIRVPVPVTACPPGGVIGLNC